MKIISFNEFLEKKIKKYEKKVNLFEKSPYFGSDTYHIIQSYKYIIEELKELLYLNKKNIFICQICENIQFQQNIVKEDDETIKFKLEFIYLKDKY